MIALPQPTPEPWQLLAEGFLRSLDPSCDEYFAAICRAAQNQFKVPFARLVLSDVKGLIPSAPADGQDWTADILSLCSLAMGGKPGDAFVITDLHANDCLEPSARVTSARPLRFYAGVPLALVEGTTVGVMCLADGKPRPDFGDEQSAQLRDLADTLEIYLRFVARGHTDAATRRAGEQHFRLLAENTTDVVIWSDLDTTRKYVSPAARTVLGYEPEELVGTRPLDFVHGADAEGYRRVLDDLTSGRVEQALTCQRYRRKDGTWIWLEISFSLTKDFESGRPDGYVASLRDITRRKEAEQQIAHMAVHDALTGLPNRTLFRDRLQREVARAERQSSSFAVLALDLDGFKAVNDALGHPAGDALLHAVARRLTESIRDNDTVARLGGDEFAIILSGLDQPQTASAAAQRVIEAVNRPFSLEDRSVSVGLSVGIALGQAGLDAEALFKNADVALYRSKAAGRNTFRFYEPGMDAAVAARNALELDLRDAIARGEFRLHYQPIVNLSTDATGGFEALLRWPHPRRGTVPPAEFIPLAEETGLIVPLGAWVVREACREAASWPGDLRIAVNVSALQLQRPGLEETIVSALACSGLVPQRLELEITESVLIGDSDSAIACLHRLRALGVRIALDDFGTGYSSLSYLRRFPFDKIKIDRSFVQGIADPDTAAIVQAIVSIGERLGTAITAEGVETSEQLDQVRREGCTEVQGYYYSKPLPAAQASELADALTKSLRVA